MKNQAFKKEKTKKIFLLNLEIGTQSISSGRTFGLEFIPLAKRNATKHSCFCSKTNSFTSSPFHILVLKKL